MRFFANTLNLKLPFCPLIEGISRSKIFADDKKTHRQCEQELFITKKKNKHDDGDDKSIERITNLSMIQTTKDKENI